MSFAPEEIGTLAKTIAAVAGLLGGAWTIIRRILRRRKKERALRQLDSKSVRYLVDSQRHILHAILPSTDDSLVNLDELTRQKALIDDLREELWVADGHQSSRDAEAFAQNVAKALTRTQRIRIKTERLRLDVDGMLSKERPDPKQQDMFPPDDPSQRGELR